MRQIIRWETPTASKVGRPPISGDWRDVAEALRARPGDWALVEIVPNPGNAGHTAARINGMPGSGFEAMCRTTRVEGGPTEYRVYARYVGGA